MKLVDVKSGNYIEYNANSSDKDPKFQTGDHVRTSKYKNIYAKWYTSNWSEEVSVISKIRNTVPWTYDLNKEEINGISYEKELHKTNQREFRIEKVIKKKGNKKMSNGKIMIIYLIAGLIKET